MGWREVRDELRDKEREGQKGQNNGMKQRLK